MKNIYIMYDSQNISTLSLELHDVCYLMCVAMWYIGKLSSDHFTLS